jgi:hypothetical protein
VYELYLPNFSGDPMRLQRIDVLDAQEPSATPRYLIDHYRIWNKDKVWENRTGELPLDGMVVDFGQRGENGN